LHEGVTAIRDIQVSINAGRPENQRVSTNTIRKDIEWLKEKWKESAVIDFKGHINQVLDEIDYLKSLCYEELHKSQTPKITTTEEASCPKDEILAALHGEPSNARITRLTTKEEKREANVAWVQMIEKLIERKCKLLGLDSPSKVALTNVKGEDVLDAKQSILATLADMNKDATETEIDS